MSNRTREAEPEQTLVKGQIWETKAANIEVLGVANGFVHYKVTTSLGGRRVSAQISGLEPMANYLLVNRARLTDRNCLSPLINANRLSALIDANLNGRNRVSPLLEVN